MFDQAFNGNAALSLVRWRDLPRRCPAWPGTVSPELCGVKINNIRPGTGPGVAGRANDGDPFADHGTDKRPHWRQEQGDADEVTDEPRQDQKQCGKSDHGRIGKAFIRNLTAIHLAANAGQNRKTLKPQQNCAQNTGEYDQTDCCKHTYLAADQDEDSNLNEGERKKYQKKKRQFAQVPFNRTDMVARKKSVESGFE
jgi:hypothetical protein